MRDTEGDNNDGLDGDGDQHGDGDEHGDDDGDGSLHFTIWISCWF